MLGNFLGCITGVKDPSKAQEGRWDISRDTAAEKGLISCGDMLFHFPIELEKQCLASCRVDIGIGGFLLRCHRAVKYAVFRVDPRGDHRVSAGESGVSGVDWNIGVFRNGGTTSGV